MAELHQLGVIDAADGLAAKQFSSSELVSQHLKRIERLNPSLNAVIHLDADAAKASAAAADQARAGGDNRPLLGVPMIVKDVLNVQGQPCTCGSKILKPYRAAYDATAIAKLKQAGAIILGRANMDEFAMGSSNENSAYGPARNPWDASRVPGGSSGGSAVAVAADLACAALGSDTGGSVRQPASFCGCVGLKPSYGRVSRYGLVAYASSLDQIGPMTKSVADAAALLGTISGRDPHDSTSVDRPVPDYRAGLKPDLKGVRLGLPQEYFIEGVDAEVRRLVEQAIETCRGLGAEIVDVSLPRTKHAIATYYIIATAEASANLARFDGIRYGARVDGEDPIELYGRTRAAGFGDEVKRRIILGTYVLSSGYHDAYYIRAQKVRTLIQRDFAAAFERCDALLTPVSPMPPWKIGEQADDPVQNYLADIFTVTANLAGIPGMSVPCGLTAAGLPVGLQILGPAFREDTVLRVGHAYEQAGPWQGRKPAV